MSNSRCCGNCKWIGRGQSGVYYCNYGPIPDAIHVASFVVQKNAGAECKCHSPKSVSGTSKKEKR